jgi:hypothetical protein
MASAAATALGERLPVAAPLATLPGTLFPFLLLAGALRHAGRRSSPWLLIVGGGIGALRFALTLAGRVRRRDGGERVVHSRAEVAFDALGKPAQMSGTGHDVTERVSAQEQRLALEARMREAQRLERS